ncbi:oligopeptidase b, putative [Ichthyophthirius multifiliis]|uniref:Prolyl endopeptidase n=1 Tax=Ichthyophthirius multifiliis TaxID=5932 RepID=G0QRA8_ICHMU|nr:oligopeptidase b, putative [Ichthyophthirius multifiliis]EGR32260.1 oligopeptidase b, putative [Ichthyophthirius multifiliis]|eukprot:XP_004035746.1 oligopeptidase b, putative [Ichthyophthirius multifiliis]
MIDYGQIRYINLIQTKDKKYFSILCTSKDSTEIHVLDRKTFKKKILISRNDKAKAFCNHANGKFYILINIDPKTKQKYYDFKVLTQAYNQQNFEDFYIPQEGEIIKEMDIFEHTLALYCSRQGTEYVRIIDQDTKNTHIVELGDQYKAGTIIQPGLNENLAVETFRFHVDTPFSYNQVFDYNIKKKKAFLLSDFDMKGPKFNKDKFLIEQIFAPSQDGQKIPITIIREKNFYKNRKNKLLLHGYGHYGISLEIGFSINYLSALEGGWTLGFAHVRGGGENGCKWHENAILDKKPVSFFDFISCAEFLVAEGYTHPSLLCAYGSSAGGLLVGTVINMRPELFKACVLNFPFLDVLSSLIDDKLPLTQSDYSEFGNPLFNDYYYNLISSYCPYQNIRFDTEYPAVFITCGSSDHRAPLWNVLKYVNRFRERSKSPQKVNEFCDKNILVNILDSGHNGESGAIQGIKEKSIYLAFLEYVVMNQNKDISVQIK